MKILAGKNKTSSFDDALFYYFASNSSRLFSFAQIFYSDYLPLLLAGIQTGRLQY
jgi:hypothetical protein